MALTIKINPAVLKWVMDNEGWNADELARESGLSASQIQLWASTESDISIGDLRKISNNFKRSMSALFMDEVPDVDIPRFRRIGVNEAGTRRLSRGSLDVIREARYVQGNAADLLDAMGRSKLPDAPRATTEEGPDSAAARSARRLGIVPPRRTGSGEGRDMQRYKDIREKIESQGIFTMQAAIPAEDGVSGFALAEPAPAVILVNSRDQVRRRIFTLLHEYAHVTLKDVGVACAAEDSHDGGNAAGGNDTTGDIERWCNRFAAAVLMPRAEFRDAMQDAHDADRDPLRVVTSLSDRFCVSRAAALMRALEMLDGHGTAAGYSRCYGLIGRGAARQDEDNGGDREGISVPRAAACMARRGYKYARLVLEAERSDIVTTNTALEYLGIKLNHLSDLRSRCGAG